MRIIGLAGGIGSGKSTVADILQELGAVTIDLDKVGHLVLRQPDVRGRLVDEFGKDILDAQGNIDRKILGDIVFNDMQALGELNSIVHPAIDAYVSGKAEEYSRQGVEVLVLEAAAMLEAKRDWQVDEIWVTTAPEGKVIERLKGGPDISEETIRARIRSQMSSEERARRADVVIDNNGSLDELRDRVKLEWEKLRGRI
jgi:dephospho-CoA kinase